MRHVITQQIQSPMQAATEMTVPVGVSEIDGAALSVKLPMVAVPEAIEDISRVVMVESVGLRVVGFGVGGAGVVVVVDSESKFHLNHSSLSVSPFESSEGVIHDAMEI